MADVASLVLLVPCSACDQVGWSAVNTIAGAQTLRVVADDNISHAVGVAVIAVITLFLGLLSVSPLVPPLSRHHRLSR